MKQIKDMTTAEWRKAWTEIAIAFEMEPEERNGVQYRDAKAGLCYAFNNYVLDLIDMRMAGFSALPYDKCWFPAQFWMIDGYGNFRAANGRGKWDRECDILRATYAAMFAAMTPKEFLAICEAPRG